LFSDIIQKALEKKESIGEELAVVDQLLSNLFSNLANVHIDVLAQKGKKIRATLFFYFFNKFSESSKNFIDSSYEFTDLRLGLSAAPLGLAKDKKKKIWTAALIEAIHFASIIHDDIVDDGTMRRGSTSLCQAFGRKFSVLIGDYIFANASKLFLNLHQDDQFIRNLFLRECSSTIRGALKEQEITISTDIENCLRITSLKTSPFFKLSCFLGAYLASNDFKASIKAATFGTCFGLLYQLQNDLDCFRFENYFESEDYVQNNITLPIIILHQYFNINTSSDPENPQANYNKIKTKIYSEQFCEILQNFTQKYYEIVISDLI
jgi:geranylgeranyl pyrophosphate synthase